MPRDLFPLAAVLAAASLLGGAPPAAAEPAQDPSANGAVALDEAPPAPLPAGPANAGGDEPGEAATGQIESRPLGTPRPLLSTRSADEAGSGRGSALRSLDPRTNEITRVAASLAVVVGLMLGVRFFLKRAGGSLPAAARPSGVVQVLARYPAGRGQRLILMKVARRVLLVHQSGSAMSPLSEFTDADEVAALLAGLEEGSRGRNAARFSRLLRSFQESHDHGLDSPDRPETLFVDSAGRQIIDLTRPRRRFALPVGRGQTA